MLETELRGAYDNEPSSITLYVAEKLDVVNASLRNDPPQFNFVIDNIVVDLMAPMSLFDNVDRDRRHPSLVETTLVSKHCDGPFAVRAVQTIGQVTYWVFRKYI